MELVLSFAFGLLIGLVNVLIVYLIQETKYKALFNVHIITHQQYVQCLSEVVQLREILMLRESDDEDKDLDDDDDFTTPLN